MHFKFSLEITFEYNFPFVTLLPSFHISSINLRLCAVRGFLVRPFCIIYGIRVQVYVGEVKEGTI